MRNKPVIGVIPLIDYGRESYWMLPGYFGGVEQAGGLPFMMPLTCDDVSLRQVVGLCDGVLFSGGQDVSPGVYGGQGVAAPACATGDAAGLCGELSPERDFMESQLLRLAIAADVPILGICRGIQSINALLGGTLWQDLPTQLPSEVTHRGAPPYRLTVHTVEVLPQTPLARCLGAGELAVNSYHHQAVRDLAPELSPMAISPDGIVEAAWRPSSGFLWALQWHPEFSYESDEASRKIFRAFVTASRRRMELKRF